MHVCVCVCQAIKMNARDSPRECVHVWLVSWFHVCFCFEISKHCQKYESKQLINKQTMYQCQCVVEQLSVFSVSRSYDDSPRSRWHFKPFQLSYHFNWVLPVRDTTNASNEWINQFDVCFIVKHTTAIKGDNNKATQIDGIEFQKSVNRWACICAELLILSSNMIHAQRRDESKYSETSLCESQLHFKKNACK